MPTNSTRTPGRTRSVSRSVETSGGEEGGRGAFDDWREDGRGDGRFPLERRASLLAFLEAGGNRDFFGADGRRDLQHFVRGGDDGRTILRCGGRSTVVAL